jgi:UDP-N-acetylmuramoyl-L-alanyl-D-glutamate--2,6-diaminopimelate ligase
MQLSQLIEGLNLSMVRGDGSIPIADITDDSRQVTPGTIFVARGGSGASPADGRSFIADAIERGASVIIADRAAASQAIGSPVAWVTAERVDQALCGRLAERLWGNPSRCLKVIGITGTNGKTTTAFLIQHLLGRAGVKCGLIGTVINDDGATRKPADLTTPGAIEFSRLLAAMVRNGCEAVVAEISSHALHQGRAAALKVDVAVFTNLTGDHLDYHKTMEDYAAAKAILFRSLSPQGFAVVNSDDAYAERMLEGCRANVMRCSIRPDADRSQIRCHGEVVSLAADHSRVVLDGPWGSFDLRLPLVGKHNVYNALEAVAAANCVTAMSRVLREAMENCPAPAGRLEPVRVERKALLPSVLVDYAHTHDALENVLSALRPLTRGRLIVLFGCGGDRDKTKRPKMAAVACQWANRVIITSDNPRTEDATSIIEDILSGVPAEALSRRLAKVIVEPDRAAAIELAIRDAGPDDVVLLAGKGHEDYQIIGRTKHHFDDREHAAAALRKWNDSPVVEAA